VNGIGPSLAGIYGDRAATVPGYDFSDAMKSSGLTWNQGTLDRYLTDPRGVVPGTKMAFGGVKDAAKRQDIINYLKSL
jgi:cytochrome c2